jgi:hypothetical protein
MCDCYKKVNLELAKQNTRLTPTVMWNKNGFDTRIAIATEKINSHVREGPVRLTAAYCPFCGEKQETQA